MTQNDNETANIM